MEIDKDLRLRLNLLEAGKSEERLKFEEDYDLYIYATRDENQFGYNIHSVYEHHKDLEESPERFAQNITSMRLMARMNTGQLRAIWLPKDFGRLTADDLQEDHFKTLLDKYSFKL